MKRILIRNRLGAVWTALLLLMGCGQDPTALETQKAALRELDPTAVFQTFDQAERLTVEDALERLAMTQAVDAPRWRELRRADDRVRLQQVHAGRDIEGAQVVLHLIDGSVRSAVGRLIDLPSLDFRADIGAERAVEAAFEAVSRRLETDVPVDRSTEAISAIVSVDRSYRSESFMHAYQVHVDVPQVFGGYDVVVDATDGDAFRVTAHAQGNDVPGNGIGHYSGQQAFVVSEDLSKAEPYALESAQHHLKTLDGQAMTADWLNSPEVRHSTPQFDLHNHGYAVEVHWAAQNMIDLLKQQFAFDLTPHIPGNGMFRNVARCQLPLDLQNAKAFFSPAHFAICYHSALTGESLGAVDVVGHEIGHAVTQVTSNLIYQGESGALNESFSDILARRLESQIGHSPNWQLGEETGIVIRDMANPKSKSMPEVYHGTHWYTGLADNGGVHTNSAVQNYWYYLLCEGSPPNKHLDDNPAAPWVLVDPIDPLKASRIAFGNQVSLPNSATYPLAALNSLTVAQGLYGSYTPEHRAVHAAWRGTGVIGTVFVEDTVAPDENAQGLPPGATQLTWHAAQDASAWWVQVSTTADMQTLVVDQVTTLTQQINGATHGSFTFNAADDTTYFWRVRDAHLNPYFEHKSWRGIHKFSVGIPTPELYSPVGVADTRTGLHYPWHLDFSWSVDLVDQYQVQIWLADGQACPEPTAATLVVDQPGLPVLGAPIPGDPITFAFNVPVDTALCWRVRGAVDENGTLEHGKWSLSSHFTTELPEVEPLAPINGAVVDPWALQFLYVPPPHARKVRLEIAPDLPGHTIESACPPGLFEPVPDPSGTYALKHHCFAIEDDAPSGTLDAQITPQWRQVAGEHPFSAGAKQSYDQSYQFKVWGPPVGWTATVDSTALGEAGKTSAEASFTNDGYSKHAVVTGLFANPTLDPLAPLGTYSGYQTQALLLSHEDFVDSESTVAVTWLPVQGAEGYVIRIASFHDNEYSGPTSINPVASFTPCQVWVDVPDLVDPNHPVAEIERDCFAYGGNVLGAIVQVYAYREAPALTHDGWTPKVGLPARYWPPARQDERFKVFMAGTSPPPSVVDVDALMPGTTKSRVGNTIRFALHPLKSQGGYNAGYPASYGIRPSLDVTVHDPSGVIPNRMAMFRFYDGPDCQNLTHSKMMLDGSVAVGTSTHLLAPWNVYDGEVKSIEVHPFSIFMLRALSDLNVPVPPQFAAGQSNCINLEFAVQWLDELPEEEPEVVPDPPNNVVAPCSQIVQAGGNQGDASWVELGKTSGSVVVSVNTFQIPDQIDVFYEDQKVLTTGCYGTNGATGVTTNGWFCANGNCAFNLNYAGASTKMKVMVTPNCAGTPNTQWEYQISCPP